MAACTNPAGPAWPGQGQAEYRRRHPGHLGRGVGGVPGPKWAWQRLRLYGAQDRALEQFLKKLEEEMAEVAMKRHGRAKQLVVFIGAASIGTRGGWGPDAVLCYWPEQGKLPAKGKEYPGLGYKRDVS
ncbi:hypothetical protein HaLaN_01784 [Haematococcus lacustris]|uniref:Uncharacterized protein n=1 Tax=Haematococcus lacustris TaxID=44745 RepID=A0A699YCB9_HAELA|nr:hypothetical protein HaLaN_01784 [Haematococcus lacustris]